MRKTYNITKEFLQEQFFDMRKSQKLIAKELGCHITVVERAMKKFKLTGQIESRYKTRVELMNVNDACFCYLLGLFVSDGTIKNDGRVAIKLKDKDVLQVLSRYFDAPLYITSNGNELVIPSTYVPRIFKDSFDEDKVTSVSLPKVKHPLMLLRGIIDGDGCIDQSGNRLRIGMCSYEAVDGIRQIIDEEFSLDMSMNTTILKSGKLFYTITLLKALMPLAKIYEDLPSLALQRKRNIIKDKVNDIVRTAEMINLQKWG